ncbi:MAG: hypothetical protein CMN32_17525 [Saprospirales bacterium]|nr:hypothetical protein [Saprospirales bacterium]
MKTIYIYLRFSEEKLKILLKSISVEMAERLLDGKVWNSSQEKEILISAFLYLHLFSKNRAKGKVFSTFV